MANRQELLDNGGIELANGYIQFGLQTYVLRTFPREWRDSKVSQVTEGQTYDLIDVMVSQARNFLESRKQATDLYNQAIINNDTNMIKLRTERLQKPNYAEYVRNAQKFLIDWAMSIQ